ncbi:MAG: amino acid adenylation domain-containing protein [Clostridia bacterium]|nr:amino acid adenylation domain-containing protein [Clostridia bacterium]
MVTNVLEYLEATASRLPDAVAFSDGENGITFGSFLSRTRDLGSFLAGAAECASKPVAVLVRRNVDSLVGMFSALYAGGFYSPIDAATPHARLAAIFEKLRPAVILSSGADEAAAEAAPGVPCFRIDGEYPPCDGEKLAGIRAAHCDTRPAYVIFTSGSTGVPKGIAVSHRSVIDFTEWYARTTGVTEDDRIGNQAPFFFDLSVKDIYLTLRTGAPTFIIPKKCFSFPVLLVRALNENKITTLSWSTAAFNMAGNSGVFEKYRAEYLKRALLGGETLRSKQLNMWRRAMPDVEYFNLYGPTETTVDCTYFPIKDEYEDGDPIPIGRPCGNMTVFLLNEKDELCAAGEPGEICAGGTGVAIGYYNDPEKTAASFVRNPLINEYPDRIFRTGDMGVVRDDGLIYYLGRRDSQIKRSGYRIELGEIESAIASAAGVGDAACVYDAESELITAFFTGSADEDGVRAALRDRLPKYMTPDRFVKKDRMPRLPNGKTDRKALASEAKG